MVSAIINAQALGIDGEAAMMHRKTGEDDRLLAEGVYDCKEIVPL
jgi:hypothetical protein